MEQGKMDEPRRRADQYRGDGDVPGRPPGFGDGAAGEPGGEAAEQATDQNDVSDSLAGVEQRPFQRFPPSR